MLIFNLHYYLIGTCLSGTYSRYHLPNCAVFWRYIQLKTHAFYKLFLKFVYYLGPIYIFIHLFLCQCFTLSMYSYHIFTETSLLDCTGVERQFKIKTFIKIDLMKIAYKYMDKCNCCKFSMHILSRDHLMFIAITFNVVI